MIDSDRRDARDELIDAYLEAVDAHEYDRYRDLFAEDVTYSAMGETVHGIDAMIEWYEAFIGTADIYHDYPNRIHTDEPSIAHGEFGKLDGPDGGFTSRGLDIFEFDEDETEMTKLVVYTDLPPDI